MACSYHQKKALVRIALDKPIQEPLFVLERWRSISEMAISSKEGILVDVRPEFLTDRGVVVPAQLINSTAPSEEEHKIAIKRFKKN